MAIAGIDLGTTNSLIALWTDSGPELVANALGDTLTPSAVSIAEDGAVLVGGAAADRLVTHPDRSVASFKRWMGSSAGARLAGRFYRAEELSALVLRALKEDAEARTGGAIGEAVISVPAYFSDPQRKATLDAARLAGITVERLVNEPTAAALAHGLDSVEEGRFLILDLGGGTFDVSLLHKFEGVMVVRASAGDSHLGGDDFRDALVALIARRHGVDPDKLARTDLARLMREAERIKHALSAQNDAAYEIALADETRSGEVARAEFEEAAQPLLRRLRAPIERAVADARVDPQAIDQGVLVGGATRMPMVRALAARLFGRFPLAHPRPDHVVALGAAAQAGLKARHAALADVVMTDVCPFTLGVSVRDPTAPDQRTMSPLIERNAVVPISRSGRYYTVADNQAAIVIEVFQGENHGQQRRLDLFQIGAGSVIMRSFKGIQHVVGVERPQVAFHAAIKHPVRRRQRGRGLLPPHRVVAHEQQHAGGGAQPVGLPLVVAVLPRGIGADCVNNYSPPHPVAPRHLRRQAGQRHERVHEIRIHLAPQPRVHPAHRGAHDQAQVVHPQPFRQQFVLRRDHVAVAVGRKLGPQPVAGLGRMAVPDVVNNYQIMPLRVQKLSRPKQLAAESLRPRAGHKLPAAPGRAVENEHRIGHQPAGVPPRRAQRDVMHPQLRQRFPVVEMKILDHVIARRRRRKSGRAGPDSDCQQQQRNLEKQRLLHGHED